MNRESSSSRLARISLDLVAALAFLLVCLSASVGRAVPPEYLRNLALHPSDPKVFVLRYESAYGGLLFSRDGGKSLQIVPGLTFSKYDLRRFVPMLVTGEGKFLLALDSGLRIDDGKGCALDKSEPTVDGLWIADLAPHPSEPDTTFLVTTGDTKGKHAGVWRRKQGMVTALGVSEPAPAMPNKFTFIATGLRVVARAASTEGVRLIEVGTSYDYANATTVSTPVLRVSDNLGMSWTSHTIPDPNKTGGNPRILLIEGSDPFKALVFLENGFGEDADDVNDPIFITQDSGQAFTPYLDKVQVAGEVALLPSGQILIADRGVPGGLWSAPSLDAAPTKVADYSVHCLAYQASTQKLFMCKLNELGYYDVATNSFCEIFRMSDTSGFVSCPDAPLEKNENGIKQLCGGYCGAAHYSSAPFCSMFAVPPSTNLCGPAAHAYDNDSPDPNKRWIEPPGSGAAPRCAGFTGPATDAGVAASDAGADNTDAAVKSDAGDTLDAGAEGEEAGNSEDAGGVKKKPSGCHVGNLSEEARAPRAALLAMLMLLIGFGVRRRKLAR